MNRFASLLPLGRRLLALDLLLALWAALWIGLGIEVAREVSGLKELSGTVRTTGGAVESAGRALGTVGGSVPVIGGQLSETAREVERAGRSVVASGRSSRESIEELSVLLGLAVGVVPSIPVLGFYLPLRRARRRESVALRRLLDRGRDDPELERFLAARALQTLPLAELLREAPHPWLADRARLARAELRRHGLE